MEDTPPMTHAQPIVPNHTAQEMPPPAVGLVHAEPAKPKKEKRAKTAKPKVAAKVKPVAKAKPAKKAARKK